MNYGQQNNPKQKNYPYQMGRGKQDHQHNLQNIQHCKSNRATTKGLETHIITLNEF